MVQNGHSRKPYPSDLTDEQWAIVGVVSLHTADKYHRRTRRPSQDQKGLEGKAIMVSQQPSTPW